MKGKKRIHDFEKFKKEKVKNKYNVNGYVNEKDLGIYLSNEIFLMEDSEIEMENEKLIKKIQKFELKNIGEEEQITKVNELDLSTLLVDNERLKEAFKHF